LEQGPKKLDDIKVGLSGGWNSTLFPRWYFNKAKDNQEITDAEIRGGLDGKRLTVHRFLRVGSFCRSWIRICPFPEMICNIKKYILVHIASS
jgi:hypothetical protein